MNKENSKKSSASEFIILEEMKNINIPFESLKPLEPVIDTVSMFQKLKEILCEKNSDWTLQIGVINYLRRIHKFDKNVFNQFFYGGKIYPKLLELLHSVRSSVSKNVLVILNEIFSENIPENKSSILALIKASLPLLIQKLNMNQSFIKTETKQVLDSLCKNVKFPELLLIILQQMSSSKPSTAINERSKDKELDILTDLFTKIAKNLGKDLLIETQQFSEIIKSLICFYDISRNGNGKFCKNILNCLIDVMAKENFDSKIEKCGKKEKDGVKTIMEAKIETKKKRGTVSSIHFRNNLKERKKSIKFSKCNNTSFDKGNKSVSIKIMTKTGEAFGDITKKNVIRLHHNDEKVQKNN